jgi:hypothetical protein
LLEKDHSPKRIATRQRSFDFCKMLLFQPALQFAGSECIDGAQLLIFQVYGRFQADPVNIELLKSVNLASRRITYSPRLLVLPDNPDRRLFLNWL